MHDVLILEVPILIVELVLQHAVLQEVVDYRLKQLLALYRLGYWISDLGLRWALLFESLVGCLNVGFRPRSELLLFNHAI